MSVPNYERDIDAWAVRMTPGRDGSHAIEHFRRVKDFVTQIVEGTKSQLNGIDSENFDSRKILVASALLHDVFDHKFTSTDEAEKGMAQMCSFLRDDQKFSPSEVDAVIVICKNVSYSKEKKGLLEDMKNPVLLLRDIVSDGDKLDAIGFSGIERCRMYSKVFISIYVTILRLKNHSASITKFNCSRN